MKSYLVRIINNNSVVLKNMTYLSLMQILNILMPIITYPYLIRVIGTSLYGKIMFAQAIISYFTVLINFGFNIAATKNIALNIKDNDIISEIVSSVYLIKLFFWICSLCILCTLIYSIPLLSNNKLLYFLVFGMSFNELLFSQWFFQGTEKMKFITFINFGTKLFYFCVILLFIKNQTDYLLLPIINGISAFLGGLACLYIIFVIEKVEFKLQSLNKLFYYLKDSFLFFMSSGFVLIKEQTNSIIIGLYLGFQEVAYYDFVKRIVEILKQPFLIIRDAIFPNLLQNKSILKLRKVGILCLILSVLIYFCLITFSEPLTYLVGKEALVPAIFLFDIMGINIILTVLSIFLGMVLIISNRKKGFTNSLIVSTLIYLLVVLTFIFFDYVSLKVLVYIYGISLLIEVLIRFYYSYKLITLKQKNE